MTKTGYFLISILAVAAAIAPLDAQETGAQDREYWVSTMTRIADPVIRNMSKDRLRKKMPVETWPAKENPSNSRTTHLEALGRTVCGIAPWLELGPDNTPEGKLREKYIRMTCKAISNGVSPEASDYLNFTVTRQPLVDAAFLCQGLLRAPQQLWGNLTEETRRNFIAAMENIRKIKPVESNWLLFSAMIEAAMLEFTGDWNPEPVEYALERFKQWYKGDAWYGDGKDLHMDYYGSYVIHPMMYDILKVMERHGKDDGRMLELEQKRLTRYARQLELFISPDGAYPVIGRSITYRFGAFQALFQAALCGILPAETTPAAVRCALTAVIRRHMQVEGNFDKDGWLTLWFCGHQPGVAERYISTGSLYLCSAVFLALGLPSGDPFWSSPAEEWSGLKAWSADKDVKIDKAIKF